MSDQFQNFDNDDYGQCDEDNQTQQTPEQSSESSDVINPQLNTQFDSQSSDNDSSSNSSEQSDKLIDKDQYNYLQNDEQPYPIPNKQKITNPYLSKYQKAMIIGKRATQISNNSPIYIQIDWKNPPNPLEIAQIEFQQAKIPFIIRRYLPNGQFQDWKFQQFILSN